MATVDRWGRQADLDSEEPLETIVSNLLAKQVGKLRWGNREVLMDKRKPM